MQFTIFCQVVFSNKKFNLDEPDGFSHYWKDLQKQSLYSSKRNFGGGSCIIWGTLLVLGKLAFTSSRMDSAEYIKVLQTRSMLYLKCFHWIPLVCQQDNPLQPSQLCEKKLGSVESSSGLQLAAVFSWLQSDGKYLGNTYQEDLCYCSRTEGCNFIHVCEDEIIENLV